MRGVEMLKHSVYREECWSMNLPIPSQDSAGNVVLVPNRKECH